MTHHCKPRGDSPKLPHIYEEYAKPKGHAYKQLEPWLQSKTSVTFEHSGRLLLHTPKASAAPAQDASLATDAVQSGMYLLLSLGELFIMFVKRDHCTALWAVQHPSMTPTSFLVGWGE